MIRPDGPTTGAARQWVARAMWTSERELAQRPVFSVAPTTKTCFYQPKTDFMRNFFSSNPFLIYL